MLEGETATALRGASARVVENMEASLGVPTATSVRALPAKLLEVNRQILNNQLARDRSGKVSFTHLIGFAVVRALGQVPHMNASFGVVDGVPSVVRHARVNLGLAIDQTKSDGTRTLLVPNIKNADTLDFAAFHAAYEDLIRRARTNKLTVDDFAGTTVSITNPGTIGTLHSVPRLMPGQGVIVGVGAITYPPEYEGADPQTLAEIGVSKTVTLTSTYDHRIIQGAESGEFLAAIHDLLLGGGGFYDDLFASFGVPYEPARWSADRSPLDGSVEAQQKIIAVQQLINMYRVRGHLIANLDPLGLKEPRTHEELDPNHWGLTIWDLDREFPTGGLAGRASMKLRDILGVLRDAYAAHHRRRVHAHPGARPEDVDPAEGRRRPRRHHPRRQAPDPLRAERRGGVRALPAHEVPRAEALQPRRRGDAHPDARLPRRRGRGRGRRGGRDGNGAPRPPERARERRREVVRADLPRVRGRARPERAAGFGRREVPRRRNREVRRGVRRVHRHDPRREPEPSRSRRPGRRRHGARQAGSVAATPTTTACCRC